MSGAVRERLSDLLRSGPDHEGRVPPAALLTAADAEMSPPVQVGDYVDFYSSLEHATNMGRMLRPTGDALNPNWRWMPVTGCCTATTQLAHWQEKTRYRLIPVHLLANYKNSLCTSHGSRCSIRIPVCTS